MPLIAPPIAEIVSRDQAVAESATIAESSTQVTIAPGAETGSAAVVFDAPMFHGKIDLAWLSHGDAASRATYHHRMRETNRQAIQSAKP